MIFSKLLTQTILSLFALAVLLFVVSLYLKPLELSPDEERYLATVDGIASVHFLLIGLCGVTALVSAGFVRLLKRFEQPVFKAIFKQLAFLSLFRMFLIFVWILVPALRT